jgi:spore maturation protein CgeD
MKPKHSIIINSYNRPVYIKQALSSVSAQTNGDFEAIVADDGSNDETLHSINEAIKLDKRIRLLPCRDPNPSDDRSMCLTRYAQRINDALEIIAGAIVHYLADDDWYGPERLAAFDELFSNEKFFLGYGRLIYIDKEGKDVGQRFPWGPWAVEGARIAHTILDHNQIAHRSEALKKVPRWPTDERVDMALSLDGHFMTELLKFWNFMPIDRIVAYKRFHGLNLQWTGKGSTSKRE